MEFPILKRNEGRICTLSVRKWKKIVSCLFVFFVPSPAMRPDSPPPSPEKRKPHGLGVHAESGELVLQRDTPSLRVHMRVAFACGRRGGGGNPSPGTCRRILHPARTCHIFEQGTLPHLFSPLILLIDWSTKARERVTCQTKGSLSSLEKETWRRMEGVQVALFFPLALIRHFSVSH